MKYPSKEKVAHVRQKLVAAEGTTLLPEGASKVDQIKFQLCQQLIRYLHTEGVNQNQFGRQLGVDRARINDIVKCRISRFTIDWLVGQAEKLDAGLVISVTI